MAFVVSETDLKNDWYVATASGALLAHAIEWGNGPEDASYPEIFVRRFSAEVLYLSVFCLSLIEMVVRFILGALALGVYGVALLFVDKEHDLVKGAGTIGIYSLAFAVDTPLRCLIAVVKSAFGRISYESLPLYAIDLPV